uniref:Uncharacterized protein n=1 Tax=Parascaris univalens TaxID=6257 RepID=A0A914ZFR9_PARUN
MGEVKTISQFVIFISVVSSALSSATDERQIKDANNASSEVTFSKGGDAVERNISASEVTPKKSLKEKIGRTTLHRSLTMNDEKESGKSNNSLASMLSQGGNKTAAEMGGIKLNKALMSTSAMNANKIDEKQFNEEDFAKVEDSHFIYYMVFFGILVAAVYVVFHNKKKIIGLLIEGRKPPGTLRRGVRYRKLAQNDDVKESATYSRNADANIVY